MRRRNALLTTNALISAVLVAALLVAFNYLGTEHHVRWDLTATREHSLSPQTIKVLRTLPGPIQAIAFPDARADTNQVPRYRDLLSTYQYYSKNFQYRIVDPDRTPTEVQKYKVASYGQIILQRGSTSYTVDDGTEEALTNGLLHVLQTAKKTVYVLQGEGETPLDNFDRNGMGTAKQALTSKGFDVQPLYLLKVSQVPDDAAALIVPAPAKDLLPQELDALARYYGNGGKLLVMVEPQTPAGLLGWLDATFHVKAPGGLVIDPVSQLFSVSPAVPIVTQYPYNDITQNFTLATAFPLSTPLVPDARPSGVTITPVAQSSDASYVKVNMDSKEMRFQQGVDRKGPAILAVEVVPNPTPAPPPGKAGAPKPAPAAAGGAGGGAAAVPPKGSAVIFGDAAFVRNASIGFPGNRDLFTSAVAWLTQSGNLVSIAPRVSPFDPFIITGAQGRAIAFGSLLVVPAALLGLGGWIYWRRRSL
jgi:ABC-type uncharacterized transport system involved in gliding motility auxiliary subunit